MRKSLESLFNDVFGLVPVSRAVSDSDFSLFPTNFPASFMRTDVVEKDDKYVMHVELPGFSKEDIKISLEDGVLEVSAQKSSETKSEDGTYIRRERYAGSQSRRLRVPDGVKEEDIKASFNNGVLQINVPKVEEVVPEKKTIAIE